MADEAPFRFFDPEEEVLVTERRDLPHWAQAATLCFITWRTWDSIPADVLKAWSAERDTWLLKHGIDPADRDWRHQLTRLSASDRRQFHRTFSARWEESLDGCQGTCVLRQPELARVVADSLMHFDGERYRLTDFVVMPNHVHVLAAFQSPERMLEQCDSWKHYTATRINKALGRTGRFWAVDAFDHLVRSLEQFEGLRRYIADNPRRAGLKPGEFIHYSRDSVL